MPGYKTWAADDVLTAADLNSYLMQQSVPQFASAAVRSGAILSPPTGMITYRADGAVFELWNGSAWVALVGAVGTINANTVNGYRVFSTTGTATPPTASNVGDVWFASA